MTYAFAIVLPLVASAIAQQYIPVPHYDPIVVTTTVKPIVAPTYVPYYDVKPTTKKHIVVPTYAPIVVPTYAPIVVPTYAPIYDVKPTTTMVASTDAPYYDNIGASATSVPASTTAPATTEKPVLKADNVNNRKDAPSQYTASSSGLKKAISGFVLAAAGIALML